MTLLLISYSLFFSLSFFFLPLHMEERGRQRSLTQHLTEDIRVFKNYYYMNSVMVIKYSYGKNTEIHLYRKNI